MCKGERVIEAKKSGGKAATLHRDFLTRVMRDTILDALSRDKLRVSR